MKTKKLPTDEELDYDYEFDSDSESMSIINPSQSENINIEEIKEGTKDLLFEIFRLCDKTVDMNEWDLFVKQFEKICKDYKYDINEIYYSTDADIRIAKWELKNHKDW